jgi:amino acid adenylation domain-containing protein
MIADAVRCAHPSAECLPGLLQQQARKSPTSIAVQQGGPHLTRSLTYEELENHATALANELGTYGAGPEAIVALIGLRDLDYLIGLLGILKSGAAVLPLSPISPPTWIAGVLRDSRAAVIVAGTESDAIAGVMASVRPTPPIIRVLDRHSGQARIAARPPLDPVNLAYLIYTSGSTGRPKGVMVEHRGLLNHIRSKVSHLQLSSSDVVAQTAPPSFDIAIWQFLAPLLVGGVVRIVPDNVVADPARLAQELVDGRVRILEVVPSLLRVMLDGELPPASRLALRSLIVTGEAVAPDLCRRWFDRYPNIPLVNAYGPAECSDDVSHYDIGGREAIEEGTIPIGRAIPGVQIHITDSRLTPVADGEIGELCVTGTAVGRGYLGDAARTAAAFVPNLFGVAGSRMYRTGDRARRLRGGVFEVLGRLDAQVKVRGCRIEPAQIEAVLSEHPKVRQAVVVAKSFGPDDTRLVAYVVPAPALDVAELRRRVIERIPAYMVPAAFVLLDDLPLTASGKVDRLSLAARPIGRPDAARPATSDEEAIIVEVWQQLLGIDRIDLERSFFDLGGDSLLLAHARREIARIFSREISDVDMYAHATVRSLAEHLRGRLSAPVRESARARANIRVARRRRLQQGAEGDR